MTLFVEFLHNEIKGPLLFSGTDGCQSEKKHSKNTLAQQKAEDKAEV